MAGIMLDIENRKMTKIWSLLQRCTHPVKGSDVQDEELKHM